MVHGQFADVSFSGRAIWAACDFGCAGLSEYCDDVCVAHVLSGVFYQAGGAFQSVVFPCGPDLCGWGLFNRFGLDLGANDPWSSSHPAIGWMTFGGMAVFVGWGFWIARSHFRDVFRKAFLRDERVDDSEEIMSYRTAVWLLLACCGFVFLWLWRAGMGPETILAMVICDARFVCGDVPHCGGERSGLSSGASHGAGVYMACRPALGIWGLLALLF